MSQNKLFVTSLLLFLLFYQTIIAQDLFTAPNREYYKTTDRLSKDLESARDTSKVKILIKLCQAHQYINPLKALEYGEKALDLSQKLSFKPGIAQAYNALGIVFNIQGKLQKGIGYQALNLKTFQKIKDKITLSEMHQANKLALLQGFEYQQALEYYQKSLKVAQEIGEPDGIANPLNNIGGVYQSLGYYETALENYQKASAIFQKLADSSMISLTFNNIGKTYEQQKSNENALKYYLSAYKVAEQFQDSSNLALISLNLAQHFKQSGETNLAEKEARKSLDLSQKYNYRTYIKDVTLLLSNIYAEKGQYQKSLDYHLLHTQYLDSLFKEEESRRIVEIHGLVEDAQNKSKQSLIQKDNIIKSEGKQLTQSYVYMAWIVTTFTTLIAFFFYRSNLFRKRHNIALKLQNEKINRQIYEINRSKDSLEKSKIELLEKNQLIERKNESFKLILNQLNENNIRLTNSIRYAEKIQRAFLPHENQFKDTFRDHFIIFKPKDVVSGDFYWLNKIGNKIFISVVDCTGHGVPGAFMSMIGNTLLNEIINQDQVFSPNEILASLHQGVRWTLKQHDSKNTDGMDISICRMEMNHEGEYEVQFSGAKSSVYYFHKGSIHQLKGDRKSVGGWQKETERTFQNHHFTLEVGDILYFATDGYTDAPNPQRKKLGYKKFIDLLQNNAHLPLKEQGAMLLETLYNHNSNGEQRDDISIIGVQL